LDTWKCFILQSSEVNCCRSEQIKLLELERVEKEDKTSPTQGPRVL
jgi:hypothetical protein